VPVVGSDLGDPAVAKYLEVIKTNKSSAREVRRQATKELLGLQVVLKSAFGLFQLLDIRVLQASLMNVLFAGWVLGEFAVPVLIIELKIWHHTERRYSRELGKGICAFVAFPGRWVNHHRTYSPFDRVL
jgi:hypothetical protein